MAESSMNDQQRRWPEEPSKAPFAPHYEQQVGKPMSGGAKALIWIFGSLSLITLLVALAGGANAGGALLLGVGGFIGSMLYFFPAFMAFERRHSNSTPILVLNLALGWTFVGWLGALIWALSRDRATELLEQQQSERQRAADREAELLREHERRSEPKSKSLRVLEGEDPPVAASSVSKTKICPYCAEEVLLAAIKCKHCGSDLTLAPPG